MTRIRALADNDVEAAAQVQLAAFDDLDGRLGEEPEPRSERRMARVHDRIRHFLAHDPGGSWLAAEDDGTVIGVALASVRGDLWGLSLLVVMPGVQSAGAGRALLDAALGYAAGCERAIILSSQDPRAVRLYGTSGFDLHPQMAASGVPDLSRRPASAARCRPIQAGDAALLERVDRQVRRATRGPDHELLGRGCLGVVCDDDAGQGYAYLIEEGGYLATLAATDDATATDLLWHCLELAAEGAGKASFSDLGADQQWAIRVALAARMTVQPRGPVFWRGGTPPPAYLPSGTLL